MSESLIVYDNRYPVKHASKYERNAGQKLHIIAIWLRVEESGNVQYARQKSVKSAEKNLNLWSIAGLEDWRWRHIQLVIRFEPRLGHFWIAFLNRIAHSKVDEPFKNGRNSSAG